MARKLRLQPDDVCFHIVTRIAHKEYFFDEDEKDIVVGLMRNAASFSCVKVIAFCVMSNHLHLLVTIDKPTKLRLWEKWQDYVGFDMDRIQEPPLCKLKMTACLSQSDIEEVRTCQGMSLFDRYEMSKETLASKLKLVMREKRFNDLMERWSVLTPDSLEEECGRVFSRMYDLSEFMKTLKQNISQYYNVRHGHTGGLWEGRFKDTIIERSVEAMSSVATYIDLNPWRAKMCDNPADYKWSSYGSAVSGDKRSREGYGIVYETDDDWIKLLQIHAQQLRSRMDKDTAQQGDMEEAAFTSGAIIGSEKFINGLVESAEEAFPNGHKSPPVNIHIGENKLKTLRNLRALR